MRFQLFLLPFLLAACSASSTPSAQRRDLISQFGAARTIRGRVVDEHARPVVGARFHAGVYTTSGSTPSDREGRYVVGIGEGYPVGQDVHLNVRASGYLNAWTSAPLGAREHEIVMRRGAGVRVRLTAPPDDLEARTVTVRSRSGDQQEAILRGGRATILGLTPDERQILEVRVDGFVPRVRSGLELEDGSVLDLGRLELDPGATLEVVARDVFGELVAGAGVRVFWATELQITWFAVTDATGIARIEGIPRGVELAVETTPPEDFGRSLTLETDSRTVTLAEDDEVHLAQVTLRRPVVLRGRLRWGGAGIAPWSADRRLRIDGVATGSAGGRWKYSGAAPGRGAPLGEGDAEFVLWARPGRWDLDLVASREGETSGYTTRLADLEIPDPARGERSGELDVGVVVVGLTAR